ncbi:MAG TPA: Lrp/AsnC family transcriptional regulator [Nitrososphaeria archaeon]|jgi:Lrp/AsnC family transcriptional regulator for asnA, asnC and gidA|nr:Lrp/AsnC family transcriptional regulator [Conexivisphaerales archaeon]HEU16501.1 Lrp/AsnC family transcriptional regulator [Nitrososphaeria archaeon]
MSNELVDEKDQVILDKLRKNARCSYGEIAKELGMSDVAVMKRIRKLEAEGVIKKYTIIADDRRVGYGATSITGVDVDPEHLFEVSSTLKGKPYVKYLAISSGDHQIMVVVKAKDNSELARYHEEMSALPGVRRICPSVVLDILKFDEV